MAEVEEQVQETVIEGQNQTLGLHQVVQVGVFAGTHPNALLALVGVEVLLGSKPFVLKLLVEAVDFGAEGLRVDVPPLDEFGELVLGDHDVALAVRPEEENLLQIFSDYVAAFH